MEKEMEKGNKMTEEITKSCCQQNRESCEKLMDVKFFALQNLFETKVVATEKATALAAEVLKSKLESLNELRQMAQDRDLTFVTKDTFNIQVLNIEQLRLSEAKLAGKADQSALTWAYIMSAIGLVIGFIGIAIHFIK